MAASLLQYKDLVKKAICSSLVDLVDIELFSGREGVEELVALAKEKNVKTIFSNHDFFKTPSENEISFHIKANGRSWCSYCKDRCYANMYRRCTYSSFCHLQSKKRTFLSCYHYVYGESRTDQPLKRGSIWLLSYLWRCRKCFRTCRSNALKLRFCYWKYSNENSWCLFHFHRSLWHAWPGILPVHTLFTFYTTFLTFFSTFIYVKSECFSYNFSHTKWAGRNLRPVLCYQTCFLTRPHPVIVPSPIP